MSYRHILITRFNTFYPGAEKILGYAINDAWMERRIVLFENFCYLSILNQLNKNFVWVLLCDPDTKPQYRERLEAFSRAADPHIVFSFGGSYRAAIRAFLDDEGYLITTRLDSDDALSKKAVEVIQNNFEGFVGSGYPARLLNFRYGFKFDVVSKKLFPLSKHNSSAGMTLFEDLSQRPKFTTVHAADHSRMPDKFLTVQIEDYPGWLMGIHEINVLNALSAREVEATDAEYAWAKINFVIKGEW